MMVVTLQAKDGTTEFRIIESFAEASTEVTNWQDITRLGASDLGPCHGEVWRDDAHIHIANVSYNGRVWSTQRLIFDPDRTEQ